MGITSSELAPGFGRLSQRPIAKVLLGVGSLEVERYGRFIVPLSSEEATDPARFGPKAANLAALGRAGLRIPDGFCLDADAYRHQVTSLGLDDDGSRCLRQPRTRIRHGSTRLP